MGPLTVVGGAAPSGGTICWFGRRMIMTKAELIEEIRGAKGVDLTKKQTEAVLNAMFDAIRGAVKKDRRFAFPGFGTFTVRARKPRKGRNT